MNKRDRVLAVLQQKEVDYIPGAFWFHFIHEEDTVGEGAVQAHLNYYRSADLDFIKIMSDGLAYPLRVKINSPEDWYKVEPLPRDDPFFADTVYRCRRINEELKGECCTFYNMFSPFNIVRERDYQLRSQGLDLATYLKYMNASLDDMRAQLRPMGERQVKTRLALEKIALLEKLEATADDIEAEYKKLADQYSMEIEKVKEALSADNLTTDIVLRKAIDFVKAHAAITEKTADEAEAEEKKPAKKAPAKKDRSQDRSQEGKG